MRTVDSILKDIYGPDSEAAKRLGVGRSAISNWRAWGYFPARILPQLICDASSANIELPIAEVPTMATRRASDAA